MMKKKRSGTRIGRAWLWLLIGLLFTISLLLPGSTVGADDFIPTPTPGEPTQRITTIRTLVDAQEFERPSKGNPKLGSSLNQLLEAHRREGLAEVQAFATTHMMVLDDDRVQVVVVTTQEATSDLKGAVEVLGGEYQGHYETLLQALVPIDALESLAGRPDVQVVREPRRPIPLAPMMAGTVDTEGLGASNAPVWHSAGYIGSGVSVAVIDGGFTGYSSLLGSDLPASVTTYDWTGTGMGGSPHGTACAEVVYDMAYGATMYLHKVSTEVELGNAVSQAIADDVDVISMSLGWGLGGPGDGTGSLANIVNSARSNGIFFAVAAGNEAEVSWSGPYVNSGTSDFHAWDGASLWYNYIGPGGSGTCYVLAAGTPIVAGLHWDDWAAVNQDYDLHLGRYPGGSTIYIVASSTNPQNGGGGQTPEEFVSYTASGGNCYALIVERVNATRDVCLSLDVPQMPHLEEWVTQRSLSFPADSPDAITVGAVDVSSPYPLESYSSRGPTFGPGGACSGGSTKPDIAAYANVSTVSYGAGVFNGTSAATPHAAGAAALVKQAYPGYTVTQLQNYLEGQAIDLGAAGKDNIYGSGRLYLGSAPGVPAPDAPSSLSATAVSQTQIDLSWQDNSSDESDFHIERSPNGSTGWTEIGTVGANATSYSDTGLDCGTTYYYRVRAHRDSDGKYSGYSNVDNATTQACPGPNPPSNLNAMAVSQTRIDLTWQDNSSDESDFHIERSPNGSTGWTEIGTVGANATIYSDTGLDCGITYYYRVRAHWHSDDQYSGYSDPPASATTNACGTTCTVSSTADSGTGTLRACLENAVNGDLIDFDTAVFPGSGPAIITLTSGPLPDITQGNLTIDASSAGVVLDGSGLGSGHGFYIVSDGNVIKGLQIIGFPNCGIVIGEGAKYNIIGGDRTAGSGSSGEGNVIVLNQGNGVSINGSGTMGNTVSGNLIGLDLDGTVDRRPQALAISPGYAADKTLFVGTEEHGIFKSTDGADSWAAANTGLTISNVQVLAISPNYATDQTIFAGTAGGGVFKSTVGGENWVAVNTGLDEMDVRALAISPDYGTDQILFAGTDDGIFKSADGGSNWTAVSNGLTNRSISALAISPNYPTDQTIFASTWNGGVFKSTDMGFNWVGANNGLMTLQISALAISPNYTADQTIFAGTGNGVDGVFKSTDGGGSWVSAGLTDAGRITSFAFSSDYVTDQTLFANTYWEGIGVYKSTDGGSNWVWAGSGLAGTDGIEALAISPGYATDQTIFLGDSSNGVFKSVDGGSHWTHASNGLTELGNYGQGVSVGGGAQWNTIGGDTPGERNVISNNGWNGVNIAGVGTDHNQVIGNYIGTDATGIARLGNGFGVGVGGGAQQNEIGGTEAGERNVISGNTWSGIDIWGSGTIENVVVGNFIGTDATGSTALGNGSGVSISDWEGGAQQNKIGGTTEAERNIISGNSGSGVSISGSGVMSNIVSGNYIGTNVNGTAAIPNVHNGVSINGGASYNLIGGDNAAPGGICSGACNLISGNNSHGVSVVGEDTLANTITENAICDNGGAGIALGSGGNTELPAPVITNLDLAAGTANGTACTLCTVEIFSDDEDEGRVYEGTTTADVDGGWSFSKGSSLTGPHITATVTDPQGNTSEFSDLPLPDAPTDLSATAVSQTRIDLTWQDNSLDESDFQVERSPNGSTGWTEIGTVGANVTGYSDTGLDCGTTYYYRVRAHRDSDGEYSGYSNAGNTTTQPCLEPPTYYIYLPLLLCQSL